ncbi:hypothetical protein [Pseudanabaena sp. ABRG5-3]|uniref:hypothetical protein n=1 Tax=Pseudanabaena sp. ABRG5-3 TaxID=685565 RepID=UPI0013A66E18|nr:hypothetical protein [Pseudanabaena sp. ABRG5-3]
MPLRDNALLGNTLHIRFDNGFICPRELTEHFRICPPSHGRSLARDSVSVYPIIKAYLLSSSQNRDDFSCQEI